MIEIEIENSTQYQLEVDGIENAEKICLKIDRFCSLNKINALTYYELLDNKETIVVIEIIGKNEKLKEFLEEIQDN